MAGKAMPTAMARSAGWVPRAGGAIAPRKPSGYRASLMCTETDSLDATVWGARP